MRSLNISSRSSSGLPANEIGPTCRHAIDASDLSSARPERAADAAGLGARDVAGDAGDLRVVVGVDDDLVVGSDQLEDGVDLADRLGDGEAGDAEQQGGDRGDRGLHGMAPDGATNTKLSRVPASADAALDAAIVLPFAGA
jgi:hypothetical protein